MKYQLRYFGHVKKFLKIQGNQKIIKLTNMEKHERDNDKPFSSKDG